jgi:hypothetical protein
VKDTMLIKKHFTAGGRKIFQRNGLPLSDMTIEKNKIKNCFKTVKEKPRKKLEETSIKTLL